MEMVLVTLVIALLSFGAGAYSIRREVVVERQVIIEVPVVATHATAPGPTLSPDTPHEHEYDHIRGTGKYPGRWRCGICEQPQPEEEAD